MELIPVIDLKAGLAVHAQKGLRHLYRPSATFGDGRGTPVSVVEAYLALAPFRTLYVADLDALSGLPPQWDLIQSLAENFPELRFWIDAGGKSLPRESTERLTRIVGSESLPQGLKQPLSQDDILSLDYRGDQFLGAKELLDAPEQWPERIILMSLSCVGASEGPDWNRLRWLREKYPDRRLFAAGGIRHEEDLKQLSDLKVAGALIATALHRGALNRETLRRWMPQA